MLRLTPKQLRAMYALLRFLPPYRRWGLPPADEVDFRVTQSRGVYGTYELIGDRGHRITISRYNVKSFHALATVRSG